MKRVLAGVLKSLITTAIFFVVAEAGLRGAYAARNAMVRRIPLPYALGDQYGPLPPWLDRLAILVPDDTLIWRSRPNARRTYVDIFSPARSEEDRIALLRRFAPALPAEFRGNPTWTIALNSHGDRSADVAPLKPAATVRVACLGDSWTFGMNVDQDKTYPSRLAAWLQRAHPDAKFEVINFGVQGYSSFQGLQLMNTRVLAAHPDVVVVGFGMNDSEVIGYRDKDMVSAPRSRLSARLKDAAKALEFYKLLDYFALVMKFHPKPIGDYLREEAETNGSGPVDYDEIEPWTRVSPRDFERNVREMIQLAADRGAGAVLLDNELWAESPYRSILRRISTDTGAPLVDSLRIIADERAKTERDLEARLNLRPAAPPDLPGPPDPPDRPKATVVFRVSRGDFPVRSAMSIAGNDPQLGSFAPNSVLMRDDGTAGDEKAGDGVWSYGASFAPGTRLFYVYTNSGARGRWEGLDVPTIRHVTVPASPDGGPVYLPIETFGRVYMQADNWHPDASGYDLIAQAVAGAIAARRSTLSTDR